MSQSVLILCGILMLAFGVMVGGLVIFGFALEGPPVNNDALENLLAIAFFAIPIGAGAMMLKRAWQTTSPNNPARRSARAAWNSAAFTWLFFVGLVMAIGWGMGVDQKPDGQKLAFTLQAFAPAYVPAAILAAMGCAVSRKLNRS